MYGLIGKMTAARGKRDELISILLEGAARMPGCLSYIIAKDLSDAQRHLDYRSVEQRGQPRDLAVAPVRQRSHREGPAADRELQRPRRHHAGWWHGIGDPVSE